MRTRPFLLLSKFRRQTGPGGYRFKSRPEKFIIFIFYLEVKVLPCFRNGEHFNSIGWVFNIHVGTYLPLGISSCSPGFLRSNLLRSPEVALIRPLSQTLII